MVKVLVHGAAGRMGRTLVGVLAAGGSDVELGAAMDASSLGKDAGELAGAGAIGVRITDDLRAAVAACDVAIDFSTPAATRFLALACLDAHRPLVVGTTGLDDAAREAVHALASGAPVLVAANTSLGVAVLADLAARAAALLGPEWDAEIVEVHHRGKVDAPSGTALRLADALAAAKGVDRKTAERHGRSGKVGAKPAGEIGIHAVRAGDVVGEHTVILSGPGERLELVHRAHSRELFARGALRAARWLVGKPPGRYTIENVIGIG